MHSDIQVRIEGRRGCGYRKVGGLYLVADDKASSCGKLPVALSKLNSCPHCGENLPPGYGLRVSRAPRMIQEPWHLWKDLRCSKAEWFFVALLQIKTPLLCGPCPLRDDHRMGPALMILVGEKFYPSPEDFIRESGEMGISRRIKSVPEGFQVGKTWVLLSHIKAVRTERRVTEDKNGNPLLIAEIEYDYAPGIFSVFRPKAIEVVVSGDEPDDVIDGYVKRGLVPVKVEREHEDEPAA